MTDSKQTHPRSESASRAAPHANTRVAEPLQPELVSVVAHETYGLSRLKADAIAGLTVAIVALPLSMAIAIAAGLPPERGLYTAIIGGFLISALGGSRFQIGGPAGAFIVLVFGIVARHGYEGLVLATMMAGVMMIALGLLRLGSLVSYVPFPVTVGFTAGIAVIIFASQLKELFGLTLLKEPAAFWPKLQALAEAASSIKPTAVLVSAAVIAAILIMRRFRPKWPALLLAVIGASSLCTLLQLDVATIGSRYGGVPNALPSPTLPEISLAKLSAVLPDAIAIMLLGSIESLLSAVVADSMSGRRHRSNIELIAQGVANIASVAFGGMPATGTIARTATNVRSGATSPVAGMLHAVYLLLFMVLAAFLAAYVPLAALGAVLAITAWNMSDHEDIARLVKGAWPDAAVFTVTLLLTIFVDLLSGIAAGIALALVLFAARATTEFHVTRDDTSSDHHTRLRLSGPLFFGTAAAVITALDTDVPKDHTLTIDLAGVTRLDASGAQALADAIATHQRRKVNATLTGVRAEHRDALTAAGL